MDQCLFFLYCLWWCGQCYTFWGLWHPFRPEPSPYNSSTVPPLLLFSSYLLSLHATSSSLMLRCLPGLAWSALFLFFSSPVFPSVSLEYCTSRLIQCSLYLQWVSRRKTLTLAHDSWGKCTGQIVKWRCVCFAVVYICQWYVKSKYFGWKKIRKTERCPTFHLQYIVTSVIVKWLQVRHTFIEHSSLTTISEMMVVVIVIFLLGDSTLSRWMDVQSEWVYVEQF